MSVLSHQSLLKRLGREDDRRIIVQGMQPDAIRSHSIDVYLGETLLMAGGMGFPRVHADADGWLLEPRRLYLGVTAELIAVPSDLRCQLDGVSTNARRGIVIHQTGGSVDAGWQGRLTLEISVLMVMYLVPGMRIGQLTFQELDEPTDTPYRGKYQFDTQPEGPK